MICLNAEPRDSRDQSEDGRREGRRGLPVVMVAHPAAPLQEPAAGEIESTLRNWGVPRWVSRGCQIKREETVKGGFVRETSEGEDVKGQ